jgi:hypothetical protein
MSVFIAALLNSFLVVPGTPPDDFTTPPSLLAEFGVPTDESGNQTLTVYNFPTRSATHKFGSYGYKWSSVSNGAIKLGSNLDLGSGDFTIETFIQEASEPASGGIIGRWGTSGNRCWKLEYDATNNRFIGTVSVDGSASITAIYDFDTDGAISVATFFNGTMRHVALVKNGTTMTLYVEGVAGASTGTVSSAIWNSGTNNTYIGAISSTNANPNSSIQAYLDEVRVTVGTARYTSGFTPPSSQFGRNLGADANWANVKLLVGFEQIFGAVQSGSVTNAVASNGALGSAAFDSSGIMYSATQIPRVAYDSHFDFGSGDFTVEIFGLRSSSAWSGEGDNSGILGCWSSTSGDLCWQIMIAPTSKEFSFRWSTNGTSAASTISFGTVGSSATDYNLAVVRDGSNIYLYLNGTRVYSGSISGTLYSPGVASVPLGILGGFTSAGSNSTPCSGNCRMKGLRITKGTARFKNSSYTVQTLPLQ